MQGQSREDSETDRSELPDELPFWRGIRAPTWQIEEPQPGRRVRPQRTIRFSAATVWKRFHPGLWNPCCYGRNARTGADSDQVSRGLRATPLLATPLPMRLRKPQQG